MRSLRVFDFLRFPFHLFFIGDVIKKEWIGWKQFFYQRENYFHWKKQKHVWIIFSSNLKIKLLWKCEFETKQNEQLLNCSFFKNIFGVAINFRKGNLKILKRKLFAFTTFITLQANRIWINTLKTRI